MLNGDAHHSKRRDGELRICRCRVLKDQNAQSIPERVDLITVFQSMPHAPSNSLLGSIRQFRLLYIGSDEPLIDSLRQIYPRPRYQVVTCPDRSSAEMFIKSEIGYDLFIFDHEMRDRAAFDLAQLIRSLPHRQHLSVIIVGTENENSLAEFTEAAGGNAYVEKADMFSEIHKAIGRYLAEAVCSSTGKKSGTACRPDAGS